MQIGQRIRATRLKRGLTQQQAAAAAKIRQGDWSKLEGQAGRRVGVEKLARVAAALGVTLDYLVGPAPRR
jgi:transcriptional regulator with XRE-family HTH domain